MRRYFKIDFLRLFALLLVIFLHYWSFQGLYQTKTVGIQPFLALMMRNFAMICVPIFMVITGFLNVNKSVSSGYILGLKKVYIIYLFCSFIIFIAEIIYHRGQLSLLNEIIKILCFKGSNYAWYVEMYIGLYIIIPLLNAVWKSIDKKYIFLAIILLTVLPDSLNWFNFESGKLLFSDDYNKFFPEYWISVYPIFYYYIGCLFREKNECLGIKISICLIVFSDLAMSIVCYVAANGNDFVWGKWQAYSSVFVVVMTISFVNIITKINVKLESSRLKKFIVLLSDSVYGAYLMSYLFDNVIYTYGIKVFGLSPQIAWSCLIYVPMIFLSSLAMSYLILRLYRLIFDKQGFRKLPVYFK